MTLGVALVTLGLGWGWQALLLGWLVGVLLVAILTGGSEESETETESTTTSDERDVDAALDALREQYVTGEMTETEFERRVKRLLETVEDARGRIEEREVE